MTDPLGQSQVIPYIHGLSKHGYQFSLISCEKPERYEKFSVKIQGMLSQMNIEWYPLMYHKFPPVLSTVYDLIKIRSKAKKIHRTKKIDLIHCRSYISSMVGLYMKKNFNIPFIFDMRGFWADERVDGGLWNLSNPLYRSIYKYFKKKEYKFVAYSDAVISLTEAGKKEMQQWDSYKKFNPTIDVIPCSADFSVFKPLSKEERQFNKEKLGISADALSIGYLGSIGTWYMINEMLDFFYELLQKYPQSKFLFITPDKPASIYHAAKDKGISSESIIVKFAQREEVAQLIGITDFNIFFIRPTYSKISSSPTKLGELLAMGIPVICNSKVGDVEEIIQSTEGGIVIDKFDRDNYKKVVDQIEELRNINPEKLRLRGMEYYSLEKAVDSYCRVYKKVLS